MPHTKRKTAVPPPWKPAAFVSVTLTSEDKERIKMVELDAGRLDDGLHSLVLAGYKFSLKTDVQNQCFACYMIAPDDSENKGAILTGRGSTPLKSLRQVLYIHYVILEGSWPDVNEPLRSDIDD